MLGMPTILCRLQQIRCAKPKRLDSAIALWEDKTVTCGRGTRFEKMGMRDIACQVDFDVLMALRFKDGWLDEVLLKQMMQSPYNFNISPWCDNKSPDGSCFISIPVLDRAI